jgi:hypothetical protein
MKTNYEKLMKINYEKLLIFYLPFTQNLPPFPLLRGPGGLGVATGQGIPATSRMHVLCPQIHKN